MLTVLLTFAFDYIIEATLVGIAFFAIFGYNPVFVHSKKTLLIYLAIFAALKLYWMPAVEAMDISIKIGNNSVLKLLHLKDEYINMTKLLYFGWFDFFACFAQSAIAYYAGDFVYKNFTRRGLTMRCN
jgi:hypothetical protein